MRDIKFRAWDKDNFEMFTYDDIGDVIFGLENDGSVSLFICDSEESPNVEIMQFTGLTDKNGVDIYNGDLINVFFTSNDGEHIHDCIYEVRKGTLGGIELNFKSLLWESYGWNQHTLSSTLSESLTRISEDYQNRGRLLLNASWGENHPYRERWKEIDESRYFEVIGNIHQNPELLEPV